MAVFLAYLCKIDFAGKVSEHMPVRWRSPNQIDPAATFLSLVISVSLGAKWFPHAIGNLFRQFTMGNVERSFAPLIEWQMERVPARAEGYSLDLDSTIFERYGRQEGSLKGHNPPKHGRPSHHPLLAVLSEAHFILHGWLHGGMESLPFSRKPWRERDSARSSVLSKPIPVASTTRC